MDKTYSPINEEKIYEMWEANKLFVAKIDKKKKPFSIILPPPNANDPLHAGHALFTVEDIMIRWHRMMGEPTLWLPGTDHAGIETQFVFEKKLQKEGRSRFDFDRNTLFEMIAEYVDKNRDVAKKQMKRLGFSLDWSREKFTLDKEHTERICAVFYKMIKDGLVYRDEKIVNYCTFCGTAFSSLEINHKNVEGKLWYIKYPIVGEKNKYILVATTRPETMLGDSAVAVNPKDKRYKNLIGKKLLLPIVNKEIPIIGEESIDMEFGTGAVKVTPAHSPEDYDMGKKYNLEFVRIIDYDGRTNKNVPEQYQGLFSNKVREKIVEEMTGLGLMEKIENYSHEVGHCYKCGRVVEPITAPQWFVKIDSLAIPATKAVESGEIKIIPGRYKKNYLTWMKEIKDWPISRQIVWGHRIPIWYSLDKNKDIRVTFKNKSGEIESLDWNGNENRYEEIRIGLQSLIAPIDSKYYLSETDALKNGKYVLQETDTFDTWFSSGQWPYSTLGWDINGKHNPDFEYFYPTTVLDTMWDILFFWVARMIMMGLYVTGKIPFTVAHMHSRVLDSKGQKMSKSKGNAIDPVDIVNKHGADALRLALVYGVAPGSDIALSEDKIRAQRNFVNKIWNASRFIEMIAEKNKYFEIEIDKNKLNIDDKEILEKLNKLTMSVNSNLKKYRFGNASEDIYQFFWKEFCDVYIEKTKNRGKEVVPVLLKVLIDSLKLLHPFAPFVTEEIFQEFRIKFGFEEKYLATASWPKS